MNAAQTAMYFAEFGKLRDVLKARAWSSKRIEEHRHTITVRALGRDKSSKHFANADLDKVLAVITAERAPADFDAQMSLQDMPEKRVTILQTRIHELSLRIGLTAGSEGNYVQGIAKRMFGTDQIGDLSEQQMRVIEGVLRKRLRQLSLTVEQIEEIEREVAYSATATLKIVSRHLDKRAIEAEQPF